jgi:hypothetical protein
MDVRPTHGYLGIALTCAAAFGVACLALHGWKSLVALGITGAWILGALFLVVVIFRDKPRLIIDNGRSELATFPMAIFSDFNEEAWYSTDIVDFSTTDVYFSAALGGTGPTGPVGQTGARLTRPVAYLDVRNEPKRKNSTRYAEKVVLTLAFYEGDKELYVINGRWSDLDQRQAPETYSIKRERDIPPNGNRYRIDVAAILDDGCYAMNDRARQGGYKVYPLPSPVRVEVTANGVGTLKTKGSWVLENDGGATISLTPT